MKTTDCQAFREDLKAYMDSELPLARRLSIRAHLSGCAACREELTQMEQIATDLKEFERLPETKLSPQLRARVLAELEGICQNQERPARLPFWKRPPLLALSGAGMVLATATVLLLFYTPARQAAEERTRASLEYAAPAAGIAAEAEPADTFAPATVAPTASDRAVSNSAPAPAPVAVQEARGPRQKLARKPATDSPGAARPAVPAPAIALDSPEKSGKAKAVTMRSRVSPDAVETSAVARGKVESQTAGLTPPAGRSFARTVTTETRAAAPAPSADQDNLESGVLKVVVSDLEAAAARAEEAAQKQGGQVTSSSVKGEGEGKSASRELTLTLPAVRAEMVADAIAALGETRERGLPAVGSGGASSILLKVTLIQR